MEQKKLTKTKKRVLLAALCIAAVALLGCFFYARINNTLQNSDIAWRYDESKNQWFVSSGKAPQCSEPFRFEQSPVEISKIDSVLMPGSYRGFNYKPHGGFGLKSVQGVANVIMPTDATLVGLTRYLEGNPSDLQYVATFESDCGIAFRFDHLHTLSPKLQKIANQTPEPKLNDTRSSPSVAFTRTKFMSGELLATRVGMPSAQLYGFDFGVYDYRKQNEISKNSKWAQIHNQYQSQEWFGVCWFDMLPVSDSSAVKQLSLVQMNTNRVTKITSDYCSNAPYTTLDTNNGEPVEG